jgi:hypothetical protein
MAEEEVHNVGLVQYRGELSLSHPLFTSPPNERYVYLNIV